MNTCCLKLLDNLSIARPINSAERSEKTGTPIAHFHHIPPNRHTAAKEDIKTADDFEQQAKILNSHYTITPNEPNQATLLWIPRISRRSDLTLFLKIVHKPIYHTIKPPEIPARILNANTVDIPAETENRAPEGKPESEHDPEHDHAIGVFENLEGDDDDDGEEEN